MLRTRSKPASVLGAGICEVDDAILINIKVIGELEWDTIKICNNWLCHSTFRPNFHDTQVAICNVKLPSLFMESESQRPATDVLILWLLFSWELVIITDLWPDRFPPTTSCPFRSPKWYKVQDKTKKQDDKKIFSLQRCWKRTQKTWSQEILSVVTYCCWWWRKWSSQAQDHPSEWCAHHSRLYKDLSLEGRMQCSQDPQIPPSTSHPWLAVCCDCRGWSWEEDYRQAVQCTGDRNPENSTQSTASKDLLPSTTLPMQRAQNPQQDSDPSFPSSSSSDLRVHLLCPLVYLFISFFVFFFIWIFFSFFFLPHLCGDGWIWRPNLATKSFYSSAEFIIQTVVTVWWWWDLETER